MSNTNTSGGIGFFGLLTILLIALKLLGKIDWSWLLVLSPALLSITIWIVFLVIVVAIAITNKPWK